MKTSFIDIKKIHIKENRQRKDLTNIDILADSMFRLGQLAPIIVGDFVDVPGEWTLIAGERRLTAAKKLKWSKIAATFRDNLTPQDIHQIELEENIKREQLTWTDQALAIVQFSDRAFADSTEWTLSKTADSLGLPQGSISRWITVGRALLENPGDEKLLACSNLNAAWNLESKRRERLIEVEVENLVYIPKANIILNSSQENDQEDTAPIESIPTKPIDAITCTDFISWANSYKGRPFSFLHCDFPYGINHQKSDLGGSARHGAYEDSPDVYWALCETLRNNLDRILFPQAHIMFWFSMSYYTETMEFFQNNTELTVQPFPLIWTKSDNAGICPDAQRQPRRVYETALILSRGNRKTVNMVSNAYSAPSTKANHISEKPVPMLKHFFRLFIDEHTSVLDPTAGSGNALIAALDFSPKTIKGLELNPEYAEAANRRLNTEWVKKVVSQKGITHGTE